MAPSTINASHRVLPADPFTDLDGYIAAGGGRGLQAARAVDPAVIIDEIEASGLRGRGGAGFPTGTKWRTIARYASTLLSTPVVVNAAEGEPGTFKDRAILRSNPYAVIEGALIAARAIGARTVTVATKERFRDEVDHLRRAIVEIEQAGWLEALDIEIDIAEGPDEYLYGEETALLEVLDGRPPFPRIAPPWRRGVTEVVHDDSDVDSESGLAADVHMATPTDDNVPPPVLVNNVETLANVAAIMANGATWFRSVGTVDSPGTVVCTVTGDVSRPALVEVPMGTPMIEVIAQAMNEETLEQPVAGVLMGVSNAFVPASALQTPLTHEDLAAISSGLGSASFIVVSARADAVAVAAGASRFLAVESCGQCTPCKQDGLEIANRLTSLLRNEADSADLDVIQTRLGTIVDGARCNLAAQHQVVIGSMLRLFDTQVRDHLEGRADSVEPALVAELLDLDETGATVDARFVDKQPDWTYEPTDSGASPAERLGDHRVAEQ